MIFASIVDVLHRLTLSFPIFIVTDVFEIYFYVTKNVRCGLMNVCNALTNN